MMSTFNDFINDIKKVKGSRNHKVNHSYGVYDMYKHIRKNKWFNIGRPIKEKDFYKIIRGVNLLLAEELSLGKSIKLPHRLGVLEIRKRPTRVTIVDGKLVLNLPIDWDATLKLWYEDEEAYRDKTLVHIETEDVFKVYYNKLEANYTNKTFYDFNPNRELKHKLKVMAREGNLDAFLLNRYD